MNYPIDVEYWKNLVRRHAENSYPCRTEDPEGLCLVLDLDVEHDSCYGIGPVNMAFAKYDIEKDKFMSATYPGEPISTHDFRDVSAHNVCMGDHTDKVTHWFDDYTLSCLIMELLVDNYNLKKELSKKKLEK